MLQSSFPAKQGIVKVSNGKSQGSLIMQNLNAMIPGARCCSQEGPCRTHGGRSCVGSSRLLGGPAEPGVGNRGHEEPGMGRDPWGVPTAHPWGTTQPPRTPGAGLVRPQYQENGKTRVANPQNTIPMNGIILEAVFRPSPALQGERRGRNSWRR